LPVTRYFPNPLASPRMQFPDGDRFHVSQRDTRDNIGSNATYCKEGSAAPKDNGSPEFFPLRPPETSEV
jgi:hypothetical protein